MIERWFRDKYKAPTHSDAYQAQPYAVWVEEYLGDLMHEHASLFAELQALHAGGAASYDAKAKARTSRSLLEKINAIGRILELPPVTVDTGIERIQKAVAAGQKPREMQAVEDHVADLLARGIVKQAPDGRLI